MRASCGTDLSCLTLSFSLFSQGLQYLRCVGFGVISLTWWVKAVIWTCRNNSGRWLSNKSGLDRSTPRMMQSARLDAVWSPPLWSLLSFIRSYKRNGGRRSVDGTSVDGFGERKGRWQRTGSR